MFLIRIGYAVANIKVDVKPWFHVKIKLLGFHRTTSEMMWFLATVKFFTILFIF